MASSTSSSSGGQSSWTSTSQAFWVIQDPKLDHNQAFKATTGHFKTRLEALKASGTAVACGVCETFEKVANYIRRKHPEGIDLLGFRMHADEKSLPLSRRPGGSYSLANPEEGLETLKNVFGSVRKFVMIEGCKTGSGKKGILKHVVSLCRPGVVGIGSKGSLFEVGFDPALPGYMRFQCLQSKQDITRIYYKRENGEVQNIPVEELMLLWDFFKEKCHTPEEKQRGFELCYQLLGERNDPTVFARIRRENQPFIDSILGDFQTIREKLVQVEVVKSETKSVWSEMIKDLEALRKELGGEGEPAEIPVDQEERNKTPEQIVVSQGALRVSAWTPYQKVYRFLLGCAFIDKYKPLLMLLDDETGYGPASQAIKALSGLTIHGNDKLSITTILAYYFPIIKKSYLSGKDTYLLQKLFEGISKGVCFNNVIKFIDDFYEERIRPSKEDRLRVAMLKNEVDEVHRLLEEGVTFNFEGVENGELFRQMVKQKKYFVAFVIFQRMLPGKETDFVLNHLIPGIQKCYSGLVSPAAKKLLDRDLALISKSLARKDKNQLAIECAKVIRGSQERINAMCECARFASLWGNVDSAIAILSDFYRNSGHWHMILTPEAILKLDQTFNEVFEMILRLDEFSAAVQLIGSIPNQANSFIYFQRVFNLMIQRRPLEEVSALFRDKLIGSELFEEEAKRLIAEENYEQAIKMAELISNSLHANRVFKEIVKLLLEKEIPDLAYDVAMKITQVGTRDECLFKIVQDYLKRGYPYAAVDVSKFISSANHRDVALGQVIKALIDLSLPHLAFRMSQELVSPKNREMVFKNILVFLARENRFEEGIALFRGMGSAVRSLLMPFVDEFRKLGRFEIVMQIGQAIQDEKLIEQTHCEIARAMILEGKLQEAFIQIIKVQPSDVRNLVLYDIVVMSLRANDADFAYQAAGLMTRNFFIPSFSDALYLISLFLKKQNRLHEAFRVAKEALDQPGESFFVERHVIENFLPDQQQFSDTSRLTLSKEEFLTQILEELVKSGQVMSALELAQSLPETLQDSYDPLCERSVSSRREALTSVIRAVAFNANLDEVLQLITTHVLSLEERQLMRIEAFFQHASLLSQQGSIEQIEEFMLKFPDDVTSEIREILQDGKDRRNYEEAKGLISEGKLQEAMHYYSLGRCGSFSQSLLIDIAYAYLNQNLFPDHVVENIVMINNDNERNSLVKDACIVLAKQGEFDRAITLANEEVFDERLQVDFLKIIDAIKMGTYTGDSEESNTWAFLSESDEFESAANFGFPFNYDA